MKRGRIWGGLASVVVLAGTLGCGGEIDSESGEADDVTTISSELTAPLIPACSSCRLTRHLWPFNTKVTGTFTSMAGPFTGARVVVINPGGASYSVDVPVDGVPYVRDVPVTGTPVSAGMSFAYHVWYGTVWTNPAQVPLQVVGF